MKVLRLVPRWGTRTAKGTAILIRLEVVMPLPLGVKLEFGWAAEATVARSLGQARSGSREAYRCGMVVRMTLHLPMIPPDAAADIAAIGRFASARGWVPATSGNFSRRLDRRHAAITRSGIDKGKIGADDLIVVDLEAPLPAGVSAETPLHVARYRADGAVGTIVHVHSVAATVLSRADAAKGAVLLDGFEMHKALAGFSTHESVVELPVFANDQDTQALAERVEERLNGAAMVPAYLLAGHGLYVWGATMADAQRHLEGIEFLLQCALEERRLQR